MSRITLYFTNSIWHPWLAWCAYDIGRFISAQRGAEGLVSSHRLPPRILEANGPAGAHTPLFQGTHVCFLPTGPTPAVPIGQVRPRFRNAQQGTGLPCQGFTTRGDSPWLPEISENPRSSDTLPCPGHSLQEVEETVQTRRATEDRFYQPLRSEVAGHQQREESVATRAGAVRARRLWRQMHRGSDRALHQPKCGSLGNS